MDEGYSNDFKSRLRIIPQDLVPKVEPSDEEYILCSQNGYNGALPASNAYDKGPDTENYARYGKYNLKELKIMIPDVMRDFVMSEPDVKKEPDEDIFDSILSEPVNNSHVNYLDAANYEKDISSSENDIDADYNPKRGLHAKKRRRNKNTTVEKEGKSNKITTQVAKKIATTEDISSSEKNIDADYNPKRGLHTKKRRRNKNTTVEIEGKSNKITTQVVKNNATTEDISSSENDIDADYDPRRDLCTATRTRNKNTILEIKRKLNEAKIQAVKNNKTTEVDYIWSCCGMQFELFSSFNQHKMQEHNIEEFECSVCNDQLFSSLKEIKKHYFDHHIDSGTNSIYCVNCRLIFGLKSLYFEHKAKCSESQLVCTGILDSILDYAATREIKDEESISSRQNVCTAQQEGILCQCCNKDIKFSKTLPNERSKIKMNANDKPFVCKTCNLRFTLKSRLKRHEKTHEGLKSFPCHICNKAFTQSNTLKNHVLFLHSDKRERNHLCHVCHKSFSLKTILDEHIRNVHLKINKLVKLDCKYCEKKFSDKRTLARHVKVIHETNEFVCGECNMNFHDKRLLVIHIQTKHLQESYSCNLCEKVYQSKPGLHLHMTTKHSTNEHICEECGKVFKSKKFLKKHKDVHSNEKPFICPTCGKGFKRRENLDQHLYTHSEARPFQCTVCDKTFRLRTHVKQHMAVHGLIKSHKCPICPESFARKSELNRHLSTHYLLD